MLLPRFPSPHHPRVGTFSAKLWHLNFHTQTSWVSVLWVSSMALKAAAGQSGLGAAAAFRVFLSQQPLGILALERPPFMSFFLGTHPHWPGWVVCMDKTAGEKSWMLRHRASLVVFKLSWVLSSLFSQLTRLNSLHYFCNKFMGNLTATYVVLTVCIN